MSARLRLLLLCWWLVGVAVVIYLLTEDSLAALASEIGGMVAGVLAVRLVEAS